MLQESRCIDQYNGPNWRLEEYQKAKDAIEPGGDGLGRAFIQRFLPPHSVASNSTLQTAIAAYYQERWRTDGQELLDASQQALWQGTDANDADRMAEAWELEKQARVLLGKVKVGGVSRDLLRSLSNNEKPATRRLLAKRRKPNMETTIVAGAPGRKCKRLFPMARLLALRRMAESPAGIAGRGE